MLRQYHINAIVASDQNGVIGIGNQLLFRNEYDLLFFKEMTFGRVCVMGRKTYESIGKILSGRQTVIITSKPAEYLPHVVSQPLPENTPFPLVISSTHLERDLCQIIQQQNEFEFWVCGGAQIYRLFHPIVDNWYVTEYAISVEEENPDSNYIKIDSKWWNRSRGNCIASGIYHDIPYSISLYKT